MIDLRYGCCEELLPSLLNCSIDLVVTSPPYNVNLGNNAFHKKPYDLYNDNKKHKEYIEWLRSIFEAVYPKLLSGGRVCINIGDGKNGAVPTSSDVIQFMTELHYLPMSHIIWYKKHTSSRTAWGSWKSPSCPSFPTTFEHILIFAKEHTKLQRKGETDLTKEEFVKWTDPMWVFPPENKQRQYGHPAMFPEELPYRLIKMLSWVDAVVFDPFMGLGTTAVACKKLNRRCIGFEQSQEYFSKAVDRVSKISCIEGKVSL